MDNKDYRRCVLCGRKADGAAPYETPLCEDCIDTYPLPWSSAPPGCCLATWRCATPSRFLIRRNPSRPLLSKTSSNAGIAEIWKQGSANAAESLRRNLIASGVWNPADMTLICEWLNENCGSPMLCLTLDALVASGECRRSRDAQGELVYQWAGRKDVGL